MTLLSRYLAIALLLFGLACQKEAKPPPAPPPSPTPSPKPVFPQVLGVPECDEYIFKFRNCVSGQVPELAKIPLQIGFERAISEWKKTAAFPEKRSELGPACALAMDASKKATARFQCQW